MRAARATLLQSRPALNFASRFHRTVRTFVNTELKVGEAKIFSSVGSYDDNTPIQHVDAPCICHTEISDFEAQRY